MASDDLWLAAIWPRVSARLPAPPARVLEIGCGKLGGFVPDLHAAGYEPVGVDPEAPVGPYFRQLEFERYSPPAPVDVVVACTSLHHVADLDQTLELIDAALAPGGCVVVIEWARERFDEATANWCLDRLRESADDDWLQHLFAEWRESGRSWSSFCRSWAEGEGLHPGDLILAGLADKFDSEHLSFGPYFFSDLADVSEADEQVAIDGGQIQANRIEYVGRKRGA